MAVGQDQGPDVVERATHRGQLIQKVRPVARHPGVDDRDRARILDQVDVDEPWAQAVDALGDLHGTSLGASVKRRARRSPDMKTPEGTADH